MLKVGSKVWVQALKKIGTVVTNNDFEHLNAVVFDDNSSDYFTDNELMLVVATSEVSKKIKIFVRKVGSIQVEKIVINNNKKTGDSDDNLLY